MLTGVALQLMSIATESTRLTLVQILLQRKGVKLNPVSTLYYVAPCSLVFLIVPFVFFDLPAMLAAESIPINPAVLLSNALAAFGMDTFAHDVLFACSILLPIQGPVASPLGGCQ